MIFFVLLLGIFQYTLATGSFDKDKKPLAVRHAATHSFPHTFHSSSKFSFKRHKARAFAPASPNLVTTNVIPLITSRGPSLSSRYLRAYNSQQSNRPKAGQSPIIWAANGNVYLTPIRFGNQSFLGVLDTGSADTWLVENNFTCLDVASGRTKSPEQCKFGPAYNSSASPTYKQVEDQYFNISYGDGEFLNGVIGTEDVTLGGITALKQTVGIVDRAAWMGDTKSSGLIGLAYPSATRAFTGNGSKKAQVPYNPLLTTMWKNNLTLPLFSMAIARNKDETGALAIGGLPGPPIKYEHWFARAPIELATVTAIANINGTLISSNKTEYQLYAITVDNFAFARPTPRFQPSPSLLPPGHGHPHENITKIKTSERIIIDSGTTLIYLNAVLAKAINALFTPPSHFDDTTQNYAVPCNATAPRVGMTVSGKTFWVDPKDMIQQDEGPGSTCSSSVQFAGDGVMIVGDVWMRSVLTVFDVGAAEMRFARRL